MPARELPGFIFDEERGRYFPISRTTQDPNATRYDREDIKRRKFDDNRQKKIGQLDAKRARIYRKYWSKLSDPQERVFGQNHAFNFVTGVERERYGFDKINHCNKVNDLIPVNILNCFACYNSSALIVADKYRIFQFTLAGHDPCQLLRSYNLLSSEVLTSAVQAHQPEPLFKKIDFYSVEKNAFVHIHIMGTNSHFFMLEDFTDSDSNGRKCMFQFELYENVHDSVNVGPEFVVALNNKIAVFSWNTNVPQMVRILDKKNKSEILSLACSECYSGSRFLYAGYRDGSIYAIPFEEKLLGRALNWGVSPNFDFKLITKARFPEVKLIVNIKPLDDYGLIAVSGILHTKSTEVKQALFIVDFLRDPCKMVIRFESSFRNLVRSNEIFEISPDGRYICYGSRDGKGNFELFSTHLNDNLVFGSSNPMVFYPLPYKLSDICKDIEYSELTAVWFDYYKFDWVDLREPRHLRLFLALVLENTENSSLTNIISVSL